jgi:dihydroorotate dehydrogenase electron transfer subunit
VHEHQGQGHVWDRPRIVDVRDNKQETHIVRTLTFNDLDLAPAGKPGQFLMVWVPGIDEIPMSLTVMGRTKAIAVHNKGEATAAMHGLKEGDKVGIRGPYGKGFQVDKDKRVLAVVGGTGIAPVAPVLEMSKARFTVVIGAQTAKDLLYVDRVRATGNEVHITTDDGTEGRKGFATDEAFDLLGAERFDLVISCGPEVMMMKLAQACLEKGVPCQCSTERHMKCGIGICDSCSLDGLQVCRDGPVFEGEVLLKAPEFGGWRRAPSGKREPFP